MADKPDLKSKRHPPDKTPAEEPSQKRRQPMRVSLSALARMKRKNGSGPPGSPFKLPKLLPGVVAAGQDQLAYDNAMLETDGYTSSTLAMPYHGMWAEGIGFMGYQYLAMLSQRSEYRQPCEVLAEEMTRKWIRIKAEGADKSKAVQDLTDAQERFKLRDRFREGLELDNTFGLSFLYIDLLMPDGKTRVYDVPEELITPLDANPAKIGKGMLKGFKVIDPSWVGPNVYDSTNPMSDTFYKPQVWWIMGKQVHASRLIMLRSRPVPDMLKPAYNFGGLSLMQLMKPYVDNWLSTRQAINDLLNAFTVWVLSTNMESVLQDPLSGGELAGAGFEDRITLFADTMNNRGVMAIDKDTEELTNISAPLGGLDRLQAQAQEHQTAPSRIPLVKLFGITPSGLNASTDGEIRTFYDSIKGMQQRITGDGITYALQIIQLNETGSIDEEITFDFVDLWELDRAGQAAAEKIEADTDAVLIGAGIVSPDESRTRLASMEGPYAGLEGDAPEPILLDETGNETPGANKDDSSKIGFGGIGGSTKGGNSGV